MIYQITDAVVVAVILFYERYLALGGLRPVDDLLQSFFFAKKLKDRSGELLAI